MNNMDIARAIGKLEAQVKVVNDRSVKMEASLDALVKSDVLAKGGKKMLYKVGALCSTLAAGLVTTASWVMAHYKP